MLDLGTGKANWSNKVDETTFQFLFGDFSPSGRHLIVQRDVFDAKSGERVWRSPEADLYTRHPNNSITRYGAFFPDDRHVIISLNAQFQIWDFRANTKKATIYLLPDQQSLLFNHETGHWNSTPAAYPYVRFRHDIGEKSFWLSAIKHEKSSGWKNDSKKAGLGFLKAKSRPTRSTAKSPAF